MTMKRTTLLSVIAAIFALIAVLHLFRAFSGWNANIGLWQIPIWLSWVAVVVAGYLAYASWTAR